ncbi:hypothetical protein TNCV_1110101 [Trichonephila clavipes]|nr:hypothetical protein TNCV_1110101 [Trichonephila clavipes]
MSCVAVNWVMLCQVSQTTLVVASSGFDDFFLFSKANDRRKNLALHHDENFMELELMLLSIRFNILKDNWGRWKQHSRTLIGSFMARRKPRVLTLVQS